ncbi:MAG: nicotinate (nicotinamide) nucleotide adenylyltransferase [Bacteroidales bacterium]|nr:nicotinate (nicotinamide) nucleotide adenylyltransferase [Bacteroidales bacterium]
MGIERKNYKDITLKTGLFFGSFNPIHIGHLIMAQYFIEFTDIQQIWFIVSPHNPLKQKKTLADDHHRLNMVKAAIEDNLNFRASDIEFKMPQPSYTINTLTYLKEKYPEKKFVLLMGGDNLESLPKWKNYEMIVAEHDIYVYQRLGTKPFNQTEFPRIKCFEVPLLDISSSFIRKSLKEGKDMKYFLNEKVYSYIKEMFLYE